MKRLSCPSTSSKRSFTLVEILIVSIIVPLLLAVMFIIMNAGNKIYDVVTVSMDIRQSARNAMERILAEVRESNVSLINPNGAVITVESVNADRISFTTPRLKDSLGQSQPVAYFLNNNGHIIREYPANTFTPIASDVIRLKFLRTPDPQSPQLDITINTAQNAGKRLLTYELKQKVRLRNE